MVYIALALAILMLSVTLKLGTPNEQFYPVAMTMLTFWGIPAAFYYPKRWEEFH